MTQIFRYPDLPTDSYSAARPIAAVTAPTAGLSANHKKMLGIAAATTLLGGVVLAFNKGPKKPEEGETTTSDETGDSSSTEAAKPNQLPPDIDVAGKVTDEMSFEQAFEAARNEVGMGGAFNWHGRWYNTFEKEEWSSLSLEQRQQYTEMITGEKLPVKPYATPQTTAPQPTSFETEEVEPTIIEGHLNGQRVMGLDFDQDGVIDTLVMDGQDGYTYRVVDATGDEGLDTVYQYDSMDGELTAAVRLDQPFVLSNDDFSQGLEASMSREVVDSILVSDTPATTTAPADETVDAPEDEFTEYIAEASMPDDTYVSNGNVDDMEH